MQDLKLEKLIDRVRTGRHVALLALALGATLADFAFQVFFLTQFAPGLVASVIYFLVGVARGRSPSAFSPTDILSPAGFAAIGLFVPQGEALNAVLLGIVFFSAPAWVIGLGLGRALQLAETGKVATVGAVAAFVGLGAIPTLIGASVTIWLPPHVVLGVVPIGAEPQTLNLAGMPPLLLVTRLVATAVALIGILTLRKRPPRVHPSWRATIAFVSLQMATQLAVIEAASVWIDQTYRGRVNFGTVTVSYDPSEISFQVARRIAYQSAWLAEEIGGNLKALGADGKGDSRISVTVYESEDSSWKTRGIRHASGGNGRVIFVAPKQFLTSDTLRHEVVHALADQMYPGFMWKAKPYVKEGLAVALENRCNRSGLDARAALALSESGETNTETADWFQTLLPWDLRRATAIDRYCIAGSFFAHEISPGKGNIDQLMLLGRDRELLIKRLAAWRAQLPVSRDRPDSEEQNLKNTLEASGPVEMWAAARHLAEVKDKRVCNFKTLHSIYQRARGKVPHADIHSWLLSLQQFCTTTRPWISRFRLMDSLRSGAWGDAAKALPDACWPPDQWTARCGPFQAALSSPFRDLTKPVLEAATAGKALDAALRAQRADPRLGGLLFYVYEMWGSQLDSQQAVAAIEGAMMRPEQLSPRAWARLLSDRALFRELEGDVCGARDSMCRAKSQLEEDSHGSPDGSPDDFGERKMVCVIQDECQRLNEQCILTRQESTSTPWSR